MIQFRIGGRKTGKTAAMFRWMLEAPEGQHRICVSHTNQRAMDLLRRSREYGYNLESWQFVGLPELMATKGGWEAVLYGRGGHIVLGIDDLDLCITQFIDRWPIGLITATGEIYGAE